MYNLVVCTAQSQYEKRHPALYASGITAAWFGEPYLKRALYHPVYKWVSNSKNICEKDLLQYAQKAVKQNLKSDGFEIVNFTPETMEEVTNKYKLNMNPQKPNIFTKITQILFRKKRLREENILTQILNGTNAAFHPQKNIVLCNVEKKGSTLFHEIGHKMNSQSQNILMKSLIRIKNIPATIVPLISLITIATDPKEDNSKQNIANFIKSNCGALTFLTLIPKVTEEIIASVKGNKIAKKSGMPEEMLKKVKNSNKKSIISYISTAIISAIGFQLIRKLRDLICMKNVKADLT